MERTNLKTRFISLIVAVICVATLLTLAQTVSSAAGINEAEHLKVITLQGESGSTNKLSTNISIHCNSLEDAMKITGINIKLPEYSDPQIYAIKGQYIEVKCAIDETSTMTIRKSADNTEYTDVKCDSIVQFETKNGIKVYGKWVNTKDAFNHYGFAGAYFTTEDGTYSISCDCLLKMMDLSSIVNEICLS